MADLFKDIIPSILVKKVHILENEKDYNAFLVNRALSYHPDTLFIAQQMNRNYNLDKNLQYLFLLNTCKAYKRPFVSWAKPIKKENLEAVKKYFNYSNKKAEEALKILTDSQISFIIEENKESE